MEKLTPMNNVVLDVKKIQGSYPLANSFSSYSPRTANNDGSKTRLTMSSTSLAASSTTYQQLSVDHADVLAQKMTARELKLDVSKPTTPPVDKGRGGQVNSLCLS